MAYTKQNFKNEQVLYAEQLNAMENGIFQNAEAIDEINAARENGEFQGEPGEDGVSVTHSWNGTVLTITSASGTSSADLKGPKGDPGSGGGSGGSSIWTEDTTYPGCFYRLVSTKYGDEYEWLNPPMLVGQYYRTAQRHGNLPVYRIVLDLTGEEYYDDTGAYEGSYLLKWEGVGPLADADIWAGDMIDYSLWGQDPLNFIRSPITPTLYTWLFEDNGHLHMDDSEVSWRLEAAETEWLYLTIDFTMDGTEGEMD